ncbi:ABC transporter ATP-binding protein [Aeromicrobium sp. YIM 150415]|uniref:ABC transporter ATP-binding protein n=1 Tax=Aeromicrobium piscarium TaxID=2590901 RepID=A0A554SH50_9ACTN|nr:MULTISPECIES: ABC transporter ATP-binding protein [Aeromicrobium]MBM9463051.1 ABC transporter ATP-binding protein [Aeromicrobium sp. YIM 150415]TSD65680.1 ABC transporter ATP-binding protein [Aeromicrobium piscarium]
MTHLTDVGSATLGSVGEPASGSDGSIYIDQLAKTYERPKQDSVQALLPVDLSITSGEFVSLVGPSGCGKTTLLMMIGGLLDATQGEVSVAGEPARAAHPAVSIAFQKSTLLRWRTVMDNVLLPAQIAGTLNAQTKQYARDLLEMIGLSQFENRYPHELSGGMQQRAAIVRSLIMKPSVLLMDEPFAALDEFTREMLNDELLRIWQEKSTTIVFVTHHIPEAVYLADRVAVMAARPGRLLEMVDVDLPRPRNEDMRQSPRFNELVGRIRAVLQPEVNGAAE